MPADPEFRQRLQRGPPSHRYCLVTSTEVIAQDSKILVKGYHMSAFKNISRRLELSPMDILKSLPEDKRRRYVPLPCSPSPRFLHPQTTTPPEFGSPLRAEGWDNDIPCWIFVSIREMVLPFSWRVRRVLSRLESP